MSKRVEVGVTRIKVIVGLRGEEEKKTICYPPKNGMRLKQGNNTVGLFIESALNRFGVQFSIVNNFHARLFPKDGRNGCVSKWLDSQKTINGQGIQDGDTIEIAYQGKLVKTGAVPDDPAEFYRIGDPSLDVPASQICKKQKLGDGSYGTVFKATYQGKDIAMKTMRHFDMNDWNKVKNLSREIEIMSTIKHPCLLKIIGIVQATKKGEVPILLMPLLGWSVQKKIKEDKSWSYTDRYIAIYGTAVGIAALHDSGVLHRDIKPDNVLLDENGYPVICDFGFAKSIDSDSAVTQSIKGGTSGYLAPEQLKSEKYGKPVDVYAFGVTMYAILANNPVPVQAKTQHTLTESVINGGRPNLEDTNISSTLKSIIEKCWAGDAKDRPTFETVIELLESKEALEGVDMGAFSRYKQYIASSSKVLIQQDGEASVDDTEVDEYRAMAERGDPSGYEKLARCYQTGRGVTKDTVVASVMMEVAQSMRKV